jgi:hypothetical protein
MIKFIKFHFVLYLTDFINFLFPKCTCSVYSKNWSLPITKINKNFHHSLPVTYVTCLSHGTEKLYNWGHLQKNGLWEFTGIMNFEQEQLFLSKLTERN